MPHDADNKRHFHSEVQHLSGGDFSPELERSIASGGVRPVRFQNVETFVRGWQHPHSAADLCRFCEIDGELEDSLRRIVPEEMHDQLGLEDDTWIENIAGKDSRLALAQAEVCADFVAMKALRGEYIRQARFGWIGRVDKRMTTIAKEQTLSFLSRKAVIPKYGFPVDVVELDVRSGDGRPTGVALQRELSQAIAENAPGGKVVAKKLEWKSCGIKVVINSRIRI